MKRIYKKGDVAKDTFLEFFNFYSTLYCKEDQYYYKHIKEISSLVNLSVDTNISSTGTYIAHEIELIFVTDIFRELTWKQKTLNWLTVTPTRFPFLKKMATLFQKKNKKTS